MDRKETNNYVKLTGVIKEGFTLNNEVYGEKFYITYIEIARASEMTDVLPIIVSERLIDVNAEWIGQTVTILGQYRSFNLHIDDKSKLLLSVFVKEVDRVPGVFYENEIYLRGYICKKPTYRKTPLGREIADVLIAVNREYGKSDYIPCILWGRNARYIVEHEVGTMCELYGRVQSREYVKQYSEDYSETKVAYEVSVSRLEV